jgi:glycosyltransferase involved in cell wall biosynthesis
MSEFADRPVVSIPNGFDRSDFSDLPPPQRNDGVFRIVHTGSMYTDIGRRQRWLLRRLVSGSTPGVDILPHSHLYLLEAIERLVDRDPSLCSRIELLLVGVVASKDREVADRSSIVRVTGYVPHREAIALTRSADLLFLPMYNLAPGMRAATFPGKTYEYLAAQRPILAAVPPGDLRDVLAEAGNAHLCAPDDVDGLATAIEAHILNPNAVPAAAPDALLDRFERRRLAAELASVLDTVTSRATRDMTLVPGGRGAAQPSQL